MANPLSIISWDPFTDADEYVVRIKDGTNAVVGTANVLAPATSIALKDVMDPGRPDGDYRVSVAAVVAGFSTEWAPDIVFSFDNNVPGFVTNIVVT